MPFKTGTMRIKHDTKYKRSSGISKNRANMMRGLNEGGKEIGRATR